MLFVENVRVAACLGWVEAAAGEAAEADKNAKFMLCLTWPWVARF